jgi:hypothetical protein
MYCAIYFFTNSDAILNCDALWSNQDKKPNLAFALIKLQIYNSENLSAICNRDNVHFGLSIVNGSQCVPCDLNKSISPEFERSVCYNM